MPTIDLCIGNGKLFASRFSLFIFILYMALFIAQGILIKASREGNSSYSYNVTLVVLLTECTKLVVAIGLYFGTTGAKIRDFIECWRVHWFMLINYLIPSGLYAVYNNLAFYSLSKFDPTTYYLLLQMRVVVTGVIYQWLFKKRLSKRQWISLAVLTCGCILKEFNKLQKGFTSDSSPNFDASSSNLGIIFILLQVFASCFAGVYNEYLLKDDREEVNMWFQNCCMYIDSILCNIIPLILNGGISTAFSKESLTQIGNAKVIAIICDNAAIGIVTALFLKNMNSILKTFASAMEIMFTAVLCWIIFYIPIDIFTFCAVIVVSVAIVIYAKNPIVSADSEEKNKAK